MNIPSVLNRSCSGTANFVPQFGKCQPKFECRRKISYLTSSSQSESFPSPILSQAFESADRWMELNFINFPAEIESEPRAYLRMLPPPTSRPWSFTFDLASIPAFLAFWPLEKSESKGRGKVRRKINGKVMGEMSEGGGNISLFSTRGLATKPTPIVRTVIHEPFFAANAAGGQIEIDSLDKNELILAKNEERSDVRPTKNNGNLGDLMKDALFFCLFPSPSLASYPDFGSARLI